jgi:hypothetical protein
MEKYRMREGVVLKNGEPMTGLDVFKDLLKKEVREKQIAEARTVFIETKPKVDFLPWFRENFID